MPTTGFVTRSQGKSSFGAIYIVDALVLPEQDGLTAVHPGAQSTAAQLNYGFNRLATVANSGDGAALPPAIMGNSLMVINDGAAPAKIYSNKAGTDTIDGTAGATGVTLTNAKRAFFFCLTTGAWQSLAGAASA